MEVTVVALLGGDAEQAVPVLAGKALADIIGYLTVHRTLVYFEFALLTCFIMHILSTLEEEVKLIWQARQTTFTALYYLIRYVPPLCMIFGICGNMSYNIKYQGNACRLWWWLEGLLCTVLSQSLAEILMLKRLWALYYFSRRMAVAFVCMFVVRTGLAVWAGVAQIATSNDVAWPKEYPPIQGCMGTAPKNPWVVQISCAYNMVTTGIIFVLLCNQCIAKHKDDLPSLGSWKDFIGIETAWPLVHVVLRDGCANFLAIFSAELILFILMTAGKPYFALFAFPIIQTTYSITATHLILNLRERRRAMLEDMYAGGPNGPNGPNNVDTNGVELPEISRLEFAARGTFRESSDTAVLTPVDVRRLERERVEAEALEADAAEWEASAWEREREEEEAGEGSGWGQEDGTGEIVGGRRSGSIPPGRLSLLPRSKAGGRPWDDTEIDRGEGSSTSVINMA